jgi:N-acetylglucosaminyldiphosphoundecaprenol N-acetyl-beta-D-mannosaminyltransferase
MDHSCIITFVNTFSYYKLLDSNCSIDKIDYIFVDGYLQVMLHNIFNKNKINRVSFDFSSLADDLFLYVIKNRLRLAIIGATENEINVACSNLKNKYNSLEILYFRNGYFGDETDKYKVCNELKELGIDVLLLGMGTPVQEEFAIYLKNQGLGSYIFTCGGFITQTAKHVDYYNVIVKKTNLRWLQRAIDYKHIRKRLFVNYPINIVRYLFEHLILVFVKNIKSNKIL